jgi:hypothetical protein
MREPMLPSPMKATCGKRVAMMNLVKGASETTQWGLVEGTSAEHEAFDVRVRLVLKLGSVAQLNSITSRW